MSIKISVVIPVYNVSVFLPTCLDSLTSQSFQDIEYLLVDDGSTDISLDICREYAERDSRFRVFPKQNGGPSSARNLAIKMARGEYISFVDSDDYVSPDAYSKIAELLSRNNNPDCLVFGAELQPGNAPGYLWYKVSPRDVVYNEFTPNVLFEEVGSRPFLWMQVMKASIIKDNGIVMDEEIHLGEDQLFQMEFMPYAKSIVFTSQRFYNYRWRRAGSIMQKTAAVALKKQIMHVDLVDRVFAMMEAKHNTDQLLSATLAWSVFFFFGELENMLEAEQATVAGKLVEVWEKHGYKKLLPSLNVWARVRLNQILLMGIEDKDARINAFEESLATLRLEVEELKKTPEYAAIMLEEQKKNTRINRLKRSIKEVGVWGTGRKILRKIKSKLR